MNSLRWGGLALLVLAFTCVTAAMLAAPWAQSPEADWLAWHRGLGQALAGYSAVLVGWRLRARWLEALGWLGLALQAGLLLWLMGAPNALRQLAEMPTVRPALLERAPDLPDAAMTLRIMHYVPLALFFLALLAWGQRLWPQGLALASALTLSFLGVFALGLALLWNGGSFASALASSPALASLVHIALFVPLLLALPAFLLPTDAPRRLLAGAWTGASALTFLTGFALLWYLSVTRGAAAVDDGTLGLPDVENLQSQINLLGFAGLTLWIAALWAHRR